MRIASSKRNGLKIIGMILLSLFLLAIIALIGGFIWYRISTSPISSDKCNSTECETISFEVGQNATGVQVAEELKEKGLIRSALAFRIYLSVEAENKTIQTGAYSLLPSMSVAEIIHALNEGAEDPTFRITFLPGDTLAGVRERLKEKGYSDGEIDKAFAKNYDHELLKSKPSDASLEGYIYGETYEFYLDATVEDILLRAFDQMWADVEENNLVEKFKAQGFTLHEGITLASVVQREASTLPDDMPKVAKIFMNRLKTSTPLGSDAIIAYYADQQNPNRDKTDMSYLTTTPCPWNSRACTGLPPTAISTPGRQALLAVAEPATTADADFDPNDLYFLTGDDQKMYYAATEAEHNQNIEKYCQILCGIL